MRQAVILTGLSIAMWVVVTLFFMLFGDWFLLGIGDAYFGASLVLLEMPMFLLLIFLALFVRNRLFRQRGSATRFGVIAATVGLLIGAITIWHRAQVYSDFDDDQHQAYAIWLMLSYALTIIVPAVVDRLVKQPLSASEPFASEETGLSAESPLAETETRPNADRT
jgi:uncharacterized membrane protein YidH (DUF202 family)